MENAVLDPLFLSRLQFAFVVSFHAIFPVFTIGLAAFIAFLETLLYRTGNPVYLHLSQFWTRVFAVVFGMGVVSGIVMAFQFGTNWSAFSYASSNFLGPVLSYEVVTAFFLEAVFLGILLFGRDKVPRGMHLFSAIMVSVGTFISSFWILATNSWMHTPAGTIMQDGMIQITSWSEAIFNPSFPYRFAHMALASFLTAGFVVVGVSALHLRRKVAPEASKKALGMTFLFLALVAPAQLVVGDLHGLNTLEHQPVKVAAMEGNWETSGNVPLLLFAIPDAEAEKNHLEIGIPNMASIILKHDAEGVVPGLKDWPAEERPPVGIVFWSFRIMVGIGMLMIAVAATGAVLKLTGKLDRFPRFLQLSSWMIPLPFVAVLAGWITTEVGRQPWLIYGQMTLEEGLTPSLTGGMALFTLIGYILVYSVIFVSGVYYLRQVVAKGPVANQAASNDGRPKRPLSAVNTELNDDWLPQR
jgi:cytochrome d ubiquinol oxidase subunit I